MAMILFGLLGIVICGGIALIISMLQPIDGIPGYKLITQEDYSIIFGLGLAFLFAAVIGYFIGKAIGAEIGNGITERIEKMGAEKKRKGEILREIESIFTTVVLAFTEEYISQGKTVNEIEISTLAIEETSKRICAKYGSSREEVIDLVEKFAKQKMRTTRG